MLPRKPAAEAGGAGAVRRRSSASPSQPIEPEVTAWSSVRRAGLCAPTIQPWDTEGCRRFSLRRSEQMREVIVALTVILMFAGLGGFFAWFAVAIRRDFRERFQRIEQRLEDEANRVVGNLP